MMDETDLYERDLLRNYEEEEQPHQPNPSHHHFHHSDYELKPQALSTATTSTVATETSSNSAMDDEDMSFDDIEFFDEHTAAVTAEEVEVSPMPEPYNSPSPMHIMDNHHHYHHHGYESRHPMRHQGHQGHHTPPRASSMTAPLNRSRIQDLHQKHKAFVFSGFAEVTPPRRSSAPAIPSTPKKEQKNASTDGSTSGVRAKTATKDGEVTRVGVPHLFDVLCGQSRICASHTGNRRFQVVLDIYAPRYDLATSKQEKMSITKEIVGCIHKAGGRFLKYKEGAWEEIPDVQSRDKTSHALRTKVASWKRQLQEEVDKAATSGGGKNAKPTHRRGGSRRRRCSGSSTASDIVTTSFDGSDSASKNVMGELIKAQREIFATLITPAEVKSNDSVNDGKNHPLKRTTTTMST